MLHRIRLEIEGEKTKMIYKRLHDVTVHGRHAGKGKPHGMGALCQA